MWSDIYYRGRGVTPGNPPVPHRFGTQFAFYMEFYSNWHIALCTLRALNILSGLRDSSAKAPSLVPMLGAKGPREHKPISPFVARASQKGGETPRIVSKKRFDKGPVRRHTWALKAVSGAARWLNEDFRAKGDGGEMGMGMGYETETWEAFTLPGMSEAGPNIGVSWLLSPKDRGKALSFSLTTGTRSLATVGTASDDRIGKSYLQGIEI